MIPLNDIKSDGCEGAVARATKWCFYELWFLMILAVSTRVAVRTPQSQADIGQIKAEILPNTCERLLVPVEGASWVGLGCFSGARQAQSITEKYFS